MAGKRRPSERGGTRILKRAKLIDENGKAIPYTPAKQPLVQPAQRPDLEVLMVMEDLVRFLARSLVEQPDRVRVQIKDTRRTTIIKLHVAQCDVGRVVGRKGRVANAMRPLLNVASRHSSKPVILEID